jgi:hypothetical protein
VEKFGSPVVRSGAAHLVVLPAINFDHKAPLMAGEICEIGADGCLPPKMRVLHRYLSQVPP